MQLFLGLRSLTENLPRVNSAMVKKAQLQMRRCHDKQRDAAFRSTSKWTVCPPFATQKILKLVKSKQKNKIGKELTLCFDPMMSYKYVLCEYKHTDNGERRGAWFYSCSARINYYQFSKARCIISTYNNIKVWV